MSLGSHKTGGMGTDHTLPFSRDTAVLANTSKVGTRAGVGDKESGIPKPVSCRGGERHPMPLSGYSSPTGAGVSLSMQ